jgi:hypothetical protein
MGAAQGFVTVRPDAQYGNTTQNLGNGYALVQKYTLEGTGAQELSEIGFYAAGPAASVTLKIAVFTHDSVNNCPESKVENSELEMTVPNEGTLLYYATYTGTKPQLDPGTYWIGTLPNANLYVSAFVAAGTVYKSATYPTWPDGLGWHSPGTDNKDLSYYAVHAAAAPTGQFARPSSDVADGNWKNSEAVPDNVDLFEYINEETASDTDYIVSGAAPTDDTCTVGLSPITTPQAGTVTMRIRAAWL